MLLHISKVVDKEIKNRILNFLNEQKILDKNILDSDIAITQ